MEITKDSYALVTEALQAISKLGHSIFREEELVFREGELVLTREDMDIMNFVSQARTALMNAQGLIYQKVNRES